MVSASASKSTIGHPKELIWDYFLLYKAECYIAGVFLMLMVMEKFTSVEPK